jgi:hypothetical protein
MERRPQKRKSLVGKDIPASLVDFCHDLGHHRHN